MEPSGEEAQELLVVAAPEPEAASALAISGFERLIGEDIHSLPFSKP